MNNIFFGVLIFFIFIVLVIVLLCLMKEGSTGNQLREMFSQPLRNTSNNSFYVHDQPLTQQEKKDSLYSPFIIRPLEGVRLDYSGHCTHELFPKSSVHGKGEMGSPNAGVEAKYYAQRPLLNPDAYHKMLELLFNHINEKSQKNLPNFIREIQDLFIYQDQFSQGDTYSNVMKHIMKIINQSKKQVKELVEYAKKDTWKGENFAFLEQKVFSFSRYDSSKLSEQERARLANERNEPKKLVVNFDLYNTLRSTATNVNVSVFYFKGRYYIEHIDFSTKKPSTGGLEPYTFSSDKQSGGIVTNQSKNGYKDRSPVPNWIFGNTIENTLFNSKGFHGSDDENIYIEGGVPDEFKEVLKNNPNGYLMKFESGQKLSGGPLFPSAHGSTGTNADITPNFPTSNLPKWTASV